MTMIEMTANSAADTEPVYWLTSIPTEALTTLPSGEFDLKVQHLNVWAT